MSLLGWLVRASHAHIPYLFMKDKGSNFLFYERQSLVPAFKSWLCLLLAFGLGRFVHFIEPQFLHPEIQII